MLFVSYPFRSGAVAMPMNQATLLKRAETKNSIRTLADAGVIKEDRSYKITLGLLEENGYNPRDYGSPGCVQKTAPSRTRTRQAATCRPLSSA
jgi:hypothetical protein